MSSNTSLVTDAARSAAAQNTADYTASVAAHVAGDWGQHNCVAVNDATFTVAALASHAKYASHTIANSKSLRFLVTIGTTEYAIIIPGIPIGTYSGGGGGSGSPSATAPAFTTNPTGGVYAAGSAITLTSATSGTAPIFYQWAKDGIAVSGATSASYTIANFQSADAGSYTCVATNSVGQSTSTAAALAVQTTTVPTTPTRPGVESGTSGIGGCFTKSTFVTLANGVQQPISAIKRGDKVRSYNLTGLDSSREEAWKSYAQSSIHAVPTESTVKAVLIASIGYYYKLNNDLEVTYEHPLLAKRGSMWRFMRAQDIKVGDYLFKNGSAILVKSVARIDDTVQTYNLDVEPFDLYAANGYIAHNVTSKP